MISRRRSGFDLPETMIEDAYKIYTDEAWHAQFSDDLQRQVAVKTGVGPSVFEEPNFFRKLKGSSTDLGPDEQRLVMIFFTIVSETLISAILSGIPSDTRVVTAVRELVADHAEDEGRHHAYFSRLLEFTWPRLNKTQRAVIGPLLPEMILAFLEPDFVAIAGNLRACEAHRRADRPGDDRVLPVRDGQRRHSRGVEGDDPAVRSASGSSRIRARRRRSRQVGCGRERPPAGRSATRARRTAGRSGASSSTSSTSTACRPTPTIPTAT